MSILKSAAFAAGLGVAAIAPATAATVFTDAGTFNAATTGVRTETFDAPIPGRSVFDANRTITFAGGATSTASSNQQNNKVDTGSFAGGVRAGRTNAFDQTLTFDLDRDVTAFGAVFMDAAEIMVSGMFDGSAMSFLIGDSRAGNGFFGLTSGTAFRTITFSTDAGGFLPFGNPTVSLQAKNFRLDDLATGDVLAPAPVPLPASALLLLGAVGGLGAVRRRFSRV